MPTTTSNSGAAVAERAPDSSVGRSILAAGSALGAASLIERGLGFAANLLGARIGGASVFGGYSLAWTTANNIASYAGGGIGSTATRFSGEYSESNTDYARVAKALALVSITSAAIAAVLLFSTAGPLAKYLIRNPQLTYLLRWSALSAGAMVLLECCRGFLIGQRQYTTLLLLCSVVGGSMLLGLPLAARSGPVAMVIVLSGALIASVTVCCVPIWRRVRTAHKDLEEGNRHLVRSIWRFGMVQLAGNVGINAAGWWLSSLIARGDTTLIQMGIFAVTNQLRNIAALVPGLLTQGSYGMIARRAEGEFAPHERPLALCSLASGFTVVLVAGTAIAILPWALPAFFGHSFSTGVLAGSLALTTAIVHMGSGAAAARLTVVSIQKSGVINAIWSVLVAVLATVFISGSGAAQATAIYFLAHLVSAILTIFFISRRESLPPGLIELTIVVNGSAVALAAIAAARGFYPKTSLACTAAILLLVLGSLLGQWFIGRRNGWVPDRLTFQTLRSLVPSASRRN